MRSSAMTFCNLASKTALIFAPSSDNCATATMTATRLPHATTLENVSLTSCLRESTTFVAENYTKTAPLIQGGLRHHSRLVLAIGESQISHGKPKELHKDEYRLRTDATRTAYGLHAGRKRTCDGHETGYPGHHPFRRTHVERARVCSSVVVRSLPVWRSSCVGSCGVRARRQIARRLTDAQRASDGRHTSLPTDF